MKIGYSIENIDFEDYKNGSFKDSFENIEKVLEFLKSKGVESIEIRKLDRNVDPRFYEEWIQLIWNKGFELTIHGDITGNFQGKRFVDIYPSLDYILEHFQKYQKKLVIPIHAYQSEDENVDKLKQDTIEQLRCWASTIESEDIPVYIALENNRNKDIYDPGNSTEGVVEMVNTINSPHVGICWDMGHYYSNLMKIANENTRPEKLLVGIPSRSFLEKVYHTHIHGIGRKGRTHFPLTEEESLPLGDFVKELKNIDYTGVYNLELSLDRWDEGTLIIRALTDTINRLQNLDS